MGVKENFDRQLDRFVQLYGLQKAASIMEHLSQPKRKKQGELESKIIIKDFLLEKASTGFGVKKEEILTSKMRAAKEARWAVIHLLKFYTKYTYSKLASVFNATTRQLRYGIEKCTELLEVPRFEKEFNRKYNDLEGELIAFMEKINQ